MGIRFQFVTVLFILLHALPLPAYQIATADPLATQVGANILDQGGNACDAAIATALALAVTYPQAGNLGGGGFALVFLPQGPQFIDFREQAPRMSTSTMFLDREGNPVPGMSLEGGAASGVPGTPAGLEELHRMCGTLPWSTLVAPAISLAKDGFPISRGLAEDFRESWPLLSKFEASARTFGKDGGPLEEGTLLVQPLLSQTLTAIRNGGASAFYSGPISASIVKETKRHGGILSLEDLASYRVILRQPEHFTFRGYDIYSAPLPSSGGLCLRRILQSMEWMAPQAHNQNPEPYWRLFIRACQLAYRDRARFMGDRDFVEVPLDALRDRDRFLDELLSLDPMKAHPWDCFSDQVIPVESPDTTHLSILDDSGLAVSMTTTLNGTFGSGVMTAGFLLNNEMDDFSVKPGTPNLYGLVGGRANAVEPGKRPLSSMSPTIVATGSRVHYVVGTPGGSRIITTVAQILLHLLDGGMELSEAIKAPRIHHQGLPDQVELEEGISNLLEKSMTMAGYRILTGDTWCNAQAVSSDGEAASDPRGYGLALSRKP
ncbi:MAG TPA: gamma-glutamyltransferase [Thermoanaerobaculia bacterium]|nr:gamma-glutamyltransferase [Thermoanaerobaculia bacterium]HXK69124.1 gamma-glutamyltransferase [Thermoanaerobaculia bacterium]